MKVFRILAGILAFATASAFASAATATPKKVGPVSYYGALHTSGNKIIGAKNNQQAMLRGVSLYWSDAIGFPYYDPTVISWAVDNLKIDVFRYVMGIEYYDSDGGTKNAIDAGYSYKSAPDLQLSMIDKMVEAAIENDVYIIIDWNSHRAHQEISLAKTFFETISKKYKDVPNVIYEIYSEPVPGSAWSTIRSYANTIVQAIRANTQNLVIVGTPQWSMHPEQGAQSPIASPNIAYVFHFYAGTHSVSQFSGNVTSAFNAGYPVFISEWGTTNADGDGEPNSNATNDWTSFMEANKIPNCNWSLRQKTSGENSQKSAIFEGSDPLTTMAALEAATYTSSGSIVKNYLIEKAQSWADSLVKGKSGVCSFEHVTAKQTDGIISGVLKSGCTYSSSNEDVVSVSGSDIVINDYGFSILTGNDGSQSVVSISKVAGQTIPNLENITCLYSGACKPETMTGRTVDYDGDGYNDYLLTTEDKTNEGSNFSLTALDPEIVSVSKTTCTDSKCPSSQKNKQVWMLHFKSYGTGRIVATAPAVPGFRAMQETYEITYEKGITRITNKFMDQTVSLSAVSETGLPTVTLDNVPITYTYNGNPSSTYLTQEGEGFVAGNQNAIVAVTATVPESENYKALSKTVTFIIGDRNAAVNLQEYNDYLNPTIVLSSSSAATSSDTPLSSSSDEVSSSSIETISSSTKESSSSADASSSSVGESSSSADATSSASAGSSSSNKAEASSSSANPASSTTGFISHNFASGIRANMLGTTLQITLKNAGRVKVNVYDAIGARIMEFDHDYNAGSHAIHLNGVSDGLYMVVIRHGNQKQIIQWINR